MEGHYAPTLDAFDHARPVTSDGAEVRTHWSEELSLAGSAHTVIVTEGYRGAISRQINPLGQQLDSQLGGGPDEHLEIAGVSRSPMQRQRVSADDDELNGCGVQQRAELFEVWRQVQ
jgi:hypothetical protein